MSNDTFTEIYEEATMRGEAAANMEEPNGNGYAYIKLVEKHGEFARKAIEAGYAEKDPTRGLVITVEDQDPYGSITRKEAFAEAFAAVLREYAINAHAGSYLT